MAKREQKPTLLVDVGNSGLDCAVVVGSKIEAFFQAPLSATFEQLCSRFKEKSGLQPQTLVLASVNPPVSSRLEEEASRLETEVLVAERDFRIPIECDLKDRKEVGADRLLVALAAHRRFGASLVVDCGTAITFDLVSPEGLYLGGAIAPGIRISTEALHEKCALLPAAKLARKPALVGKSTQEALSSGLLHGFAAMVDGMVERFEREVGFRFCPVMTGGSAALLFPLCRKIADHIPYLVLEGLLIALKA